MSSRISAAAINELASTTASMLLLDAPSITDSTTATNIEHESIVSPDADSTALPSFHTTLADLRKRRLPEKTFCADKELWAGRYCLRTPDAEGGHAIHFIEKCWSPLVFRDWQGMPNHPLPPSDELRPGDAPDAAWVEHLQAELRAANAWTGRSFNPMGTYVELKGFMFTNVHSCPEKHVCVQSIDVDYVPHTFCKQLPAVVKEDKDVLFGDVLQPYSEQDSFVTVSLEHVADPEPPARGSQGKPPPKDILPYMATVKKSVTIKEDMDKAALTIMLYNPDTMELIVPGRPWQATVSLRGMASTVVCTTWDVASATCQPFQLVDIPKDTDVDFEISVWIVDFEKALTTIVAVAFTFVLSHLWQGYVRIAHQHNL